jgi:predicted ABC-type ATPase
MDTPILYVIAGPNGIGKTTSDFDFVPIVTPVINSDEIAAMIKRSGEVSGNINTQEYPNAEALRLMDALLNIHSSFAIETNLSDVDTWKSLLEIQKKGYLLHVIYISTSELAVLNTRIEDRVKQGGHFVRPDIVEERYLAGLHLLNHYFDKPDKLQLFDNTVTMDLVAELSKGQVLHMSPNVPVWVSQYLKQVFTAEVKLEQRARDLGSVDEVRRRYLEKKLGTGEEKIPAPDKKPVEEQKQASGLSQGKGRKL